MYDQHFGFLEPPFSVTPDPRFSYTNSLYQEAFAALRYGIETRKGFIVITGEAGTGKTTLLRRFMRNVESTVHTAFIFNPHLDLNELLRLILNDLGIACSTENKLTMMAQLNDYLIEQLRKDHVVSLLIDEAQNLSDEMLEELRLLSNLETDREKLIQIVLMGQPELERNLERPELRQLKQRVAVRCRLVPLATNEVASYIDSRLDTVGYEGKALFDSACVQKIALYSKGIPRLINVLCDNALLIAYASSKRKVSPVIIEEAARDLQLIEPPRGKGTTAAKGREHYNLSYDSRREPQYGLGSDEPWSDFEEYPPSMRKQSGRFQDRRNLAGLGIGTLLTVITLAGTGVVLYSKQAGSLAALAVNIEDLLGARWQAPTQIQPNPGPEVTTEKVPDVPPYPLPLNEPLPAQDAHLDSADVSKTTTSNEPEAPLTKPDKRIGRTPRPGREQIRTSAKNGSQNQIYPEPPPTAERLEFEVYKAIHNRAIRGVEVSVQDGTVYLAGQVATDRQKLVAAQAARSVPGVKAVRDRIMVNSSPSPADRNKSG
jgi:type II secretory pathway predicted ATPase ExeA